MIDMGYPKIERGMQKRFGCFVVQVALRADHEMARILSVAVVSLIFGTFATTAILWRALARLLVGKSTWAKTRRNVERSKCPVAIEE